MLKLKAAAERLNCSVRTVRRLIARRELLSVRVSPRIIGVREEALEAFIAGTRVAPPESAESPDLCLRDIVSGAIRVSDCSAIYFLLKGGQVVYVGQSRMVWRRIGSHMSSKQFDSFYILECPVHRLTEVERQYIEKFKPLLNVHGGLPANMRHLWAPIRQEDAAR